MSSKTIIIPKGTVGPNDTLVIDIPDTPQRDGRYLVRKRRLEYPPSPPSFRHNYSLVPTRTGSPSRQAQLDQSSYWEGSPVWENQYFVDDSSLGPYQSSYEASRTTPSSAHSGGGGGNLRRMQAMGNLADISPDESSLGILTSRYMRAADGPYLEQSNSQIYSSDDYSFQSSKSNPSPPRGVGNLRRMGGMQNLAQNSRSDFSINHQSFSSPQRLVQSDSSIYPDDNQDISQFMPPYASTPNKMPAEYIEEEFYEESSSEADNAISPKSTTYTRRVTRRIDSPDDISVEAIEELSEEPSEIFDSSDEKMNDSMMGKVIAGDMGRRLVYPTPPGQPSGTGRVVHLGGNATTDRKSVQFKSTNSGVSFFSNHSINQPNATYTKSSFGTGSSGVAQPDQMNSTYVLNRTRTIEKPRRVSQPDQMNSTYVLNRTRTIEEPSSLGLMRSSQMRSGTDASSLGLMRSSQMRSGTDASSLGLMRSSQMRSGADASSLGLMRSSQMRSGTDASSLGLMRSSQMRSGTDASSLGLMRSSQMRSGADSGSLGLMRSSQMRSGFSSGRPIVTDCPCFTLGGNNSDSLGLMRSSQMQSGFGSGSLGLMRSSQMDSFTPEPEELSYEGFNPAANSSAVNLRGNQTYNTSPPDLQTLEATEKTLIDRDLRAWQEARRQFFSDMTTLSDPDEQRRRFHHGMSTLRTSQLE